MQMTIHPAMPSFSLLSLLLLLHLVFIPCRSSPSCLSPFPCGNITLKYPFSLYTAETPHFVCGYPGLLVSCEDNTTAILRLQSGNYTIFSIDYADAFGFINLADSDILHSNNSCPRVNHNVSFASYDWFYNYSYSSNLIFFYDCLPSFPRNYPRLTCLNNNSYVITAMDNPSEFYYLSAMCQEMVVAPVLSDGDFNDLSNGFDLLLKRGFQLQWLRDSIGEDCYHCETSGGHCGYNLTNDSIFVETCLCEEGMCPTERRKLRVKRVIMGVSIGAFGFLALFAFSALLFWKSIRNLWFTETDERNKTQNIEATLENCVTFAPKRYNFNEIRRMTKSFSEKLGQGGYGQVFKGKLSDGTLVAVKVFKDRKSNGEEFTNEVASIGRTSHVNIVRLLGFSIKGSKRALIYEFMPNGSLDKYICASRTSTTHVDCTRLYEIAIGIARGLEYLHRGCNTRIIHFDIKPHNILLDQDYCPKISDFGLAMFCRPKESIISVSCMRGTIGYIAPEVFSRNFGTISSKSDVYSYGMMVLEMIRGEQRKTSEITENSSSDDYFPDNIYKCIEENTFSSVYELSDENVEIARKMVIVGLWCIQLLPDARPTMSRVLDMLEGSVEDLSVPQKLRVPLPPELVTDSFSTELFL